MDAARQVAVLLEKAAEKENKLEQLACYEEALRLIPTNAETLVRIAAVYALMGKNRECLEFARRSTESEPTSSNAWAMQEHALVNLGIKDEVSGDGLRKEQLAWTENYGGPLCQDQIQPAIS